MRAPRIDTIPVPGAHLYVEVRGSGPYLILMPGAGGDAGSLTGLADEMCDSHTVVTYDRRGYTRSPIAGPIGDVDLSIHSADALHLIRALTSEPAVVFGTSLGALVGLDLVTHHPELLQTLVAHEPPAQCLLGEREPPPEAVVAAVEAGDIAAAIAAFTAAVGANVSDHESGVDHTRLMNPRNLANKRFFFEHEAPAVDRYTVDVAALGDSLTRVVPAAGESSNGAMPQRCAAALARELQTDLVVFPGDHAGPVHRPGAFAARLREVLREVTRAGSTVPRSRSHGPGAGRPSA